MADDTAKKMKAIGSIRMLQPKEHGGMEAHPREFAETVMRMASLNPSAGWVHGIVGVHPWQLAFADPKVQQEIWGSDPDTWMASPYMPGGMCIPTDGGYKFSGRWQFSSGTDHCDWAFLGAMACDKDGNMEMPPRMLHVIIPRTDYEIIEDSWDVMGLRGTGSKDLVVKDAYVPDYRVMDCDEVIDGTAVRKYGRTETLYLMPWSNIFPLGITAARSASARECSSTPTSTKPIASTRRARRSRTTRTPCSPSVRQPPTSGLRATPCLPTSTACGIEWTLARK